MEEWEPFVSPMVEKLPRAGLGRFRIGLRSASDRWLLLEAVWCLPEGTKDLVVEEAAGEVGGELSDRGKLREGLAGGGRVASVL